MTRPAGAGHVEVDDRDQLALGARSNPEGSVVLDSSDVNARLVSDLEASPSAARVDPALDSASQRRAADAAWASLAQLLAGRPRVRESRTGGHTYLRRWERPLTARLPAVPAAVPIYSAAGDTRVLVIDLDASRGGTEAVRRDASAVTDLVGAAGGPGEVPRRDLAAGGAPGRADQSRGAGQAARGGPTCWIHSIALAGSRGDAAVACRGHGRVGQAEVSARSGRAHAGSVDAAGGTAPVPGRGGSPADARSTLVRREPQRRYPILLTLLAQSAVDVLDEVLLLFDQSISARESARQAEADRGAGGAGAAGEDRQALLDDLLVVLIDVGRPRRTGRVPCCAGWGWSGCGPRSRPRPPGCLVTTAIYRAWTRRCRICGGSRRRCWPRCASTVAPRSDRCWTGSRC